MSLRVSRKKMAKQQKTNQLRIIAGKWRGRKIQFPDAEGLRPTPDRVRETLFSWLMPYLPGATCLDMFAGSGALGFEALSRGAESVVLIEKDRAASLALAANRDNLAADGLRIITGDALSALTQFDHQFDIIFLDPPFRMGLLQQLLSLIDEHDLLRSEGVIYVEQEKELEALLLPENWQVYKEKTAGQVRYQLIQKH